jgi:hypothetical protein
MDSDVNHTVFQVFLGVFVNLRNAAISFVMSVCMEQLSSGWIFHKI